MRKQTTLPTRYKPWILIAVIFATALSCSTRSDQANNPFPGYTWPLPELRFTSFFGETRGNHFHNGIDLSSHLESVYPVAPGTILFAWDKKRYPFANTPGMGNWTAILHGNQQISVYLHLDRIITNDQPRIGTEQPLGKSGNSGRSSGSHLHFSLYDPQKNSYLNPLEKLPQVRDDTKPQIRHLILERDGHKPVLIREKFSFHHQGSVILHASIQDHVSRNELHRNLGIYFLEIHINGEKKSSYRFDTIEIHPEGPQVNGKKFGDIFANKRYYYLTKAILPSGTHKITVIAEDLHKNRSEKEFLLTLNQ